MRDSLPAGFCTEAFAPNPDSVAGKMADSYDLVSGTTWEYLYSSSTTGSSGGWMGGSSTSVVQGPAMRITIDDVLPYGNCTLFVLDEHTVRSHSDTSFFIQGLKRGNTIYYADRTAGTPQLVARLPGSLSQTLSPNPPFWISPPEAVLSDKGDVWIGPPKCTADTAKLDSLPDLQESCTHAVLTGGNSSMDYRVSTRFGLVFYQLSEYGSVPPTSSSITTTLQLYRYNGKVLDSAVYARSL